MKAAFFHDHRFGRDAAGVHYSNGALPYRVLARYLRHFDRLIVVGRVRSASAATPTVASGDGVEMACVERDPSRSPGAVAAASLRVRAILERVDAAIIRLPSFIGRIACREAIRARKPWMVEVVGCAGSALWNHGSLAGKLLAAPAYLLTRHYVARAPFAVYVTQRFLQRRYPCHGVSIGCSNVAIAQPRAEALERRLARVSSPARPGPLTLGLVGSLDVNYKGHETALRALAHLRRSPPGVRLRLLGGGDSRRWRARAAALGVEDLIEFSGTVPGGAPVLEWMDALDVFLIPSLTEGLPRALVEAMSLGVPAIGARAGGIPELIAAEWTHDPGDFRQLATLVARLIRDPHAMEVQARRNWAAAREFAADVLEERRDALLARFAAHARSQAGAQRSVQVLVDG